MGKQHIFQATLTWNKDESLRGNNKKVYEKSHVISIPSKPLLYVSAAKTFKGDPALYNPEDLLLSSLMSCHMMSYLYLCAQNKIDILGYIDKAEAFLETFTDGSGKIVEARLYPTVIIKDESQIALANSLHNEANKLCFIANSCNFPIKHYPICQIEDKIA